MKQLSFLTFILMTLAACQPAEKKKGTATLQNDLPALQMVTTMGQPLFTKALSGKTILILFQPDCDHCQREAAQIQQNLNAFNGYQLYFISNVTNQELVQFAKDYNLDTNANVHFAVTDADQIVTNFGPLDTPSLFIYSAEGKLANKFIGETDISKILPAL